MQIMKKATKGGFDFFMEGRELPVLTIKTNNVPRLLLYGYQLTEKEKEQFDYLDDDAINCGDFFRYRGEVYDLSQFLTVGGNEFFQGWDGHEGHSYFDGLVIKIVEEGEAVIVGHYFS